MFEESPAATMNNRESSLPERTIAGARERHGKHTLRDDSGHFPSYFRFLGIFFGLLISELHWVAARTLSGCSGRFSTAQAHVAFL
jgi:hypothetical protein